MEQSSKTSGVDPTVVSRILSFYGIYQKMQIFVRVAE